MVPSLYDDFNKFKRIIENHDGSEVINLRNYNFLGAATLLPLLNFMMTNDILKYTPNRHTEHHLDRVLGRAPCTKTTIPFEKLPDIMSDDYFDDLSDRVRGVLNNYVDRTSFDLLLNEIINNVYDHSDFDNAYTMVQQYPNGNVTDICFIDDGISIPGNFEKANFGFHNDAEAIFDAINGKTTDKYEYKLRGFGLNTSTQISTLCFKEQMIIASRGGLCFINDKGAYLYDIDDNYVDGTYVGIRINENRVDDLTPYYSSKKEIKKVEKNIYM